jgi:hypothetical protein
MASQSGGPPISPDGRWWWDGQKWQSLYSPDGSHRWDGSAWVPVAAAAAAPVAARPQPSPAGEEAVPSWLPEESAAALQGPPEIAASPSAPAEHLPEWAAPRTRGRPWIVWGSVAVIVGTLGFAVWTLKDHFPALRDFGLNSAPAPAGRATPDPSLSQYQRADQLLNLQLAPMLVTAGRAEQVMATDCGQGHTLDQACRAAMTDTYHKIDLVIQEIDKSDVPPCIQSQLKDYRNLLNLADTNLSMAVQAFDKHDLGMTSQQIQNFATVIQSSGPRAQALQSALDACPKTLPGAKPSPTGSS